MVPEQSPLILEVYPDRRFSVTLYLPGLRVTVVPEELPVKDDGVGLLPLTVMVKSDGCLSPPPSLFTFVVTIILPVVIGGGGGGGGGGDTE
jgi:hypothetical protein